LKTTPGAQSRSGSGVAIAKSGFLGSCLLQWINAYKFPATAFVFKFHDAVDQGKQRIVFPATDIVAGLPLGAPLSSYNVAAYHSFATELLETQSL
jgi:hypothetical protein